MGSKMGYISLLRLCVVAIAVIMTQTAHGGGTSLSKQERELLIDEAIIEARAYSAARDSKCKIVSVMENIESSRPSSSSLLKHFKKAPENALKIGTAQLQYEDMIRRAEDKLMEREIKALGGEESARATVNKMRDSESLLTEQEVSLMWTKSGCRAIRSKPSCFIIRNVNVYRTIDGSCNNLRYPFVGSAGINLRRLLRPYYEDGRSSLRGDRQNRLANQKPGPFAPPNPSARFVSSRVVGDIEVNEIPFSHLLMQWGQFLDHDMDLSPEPEAECEGCTYTEICQPIRVRRNDRAFGLDTPNDGECLPFRRSTPGCNLFQPNSVSVPRQQLNAITSFIDASMVYGSTSDHARALREYRNGLLKVGPAPKGQKSALPRITPATRNFVACPENLQDCFLCGDARCNEQISLTIMHTIWVREHNRCAGELSKINRMWNDEMVYQECRKIVGALVQKITYTDYLPKIFGPTFTNTYLGNYPGYRDNINPTIPNAFSTAAYRYGHSLVRPLFTRLGSSYKPLSFGPLSLADAFFNPSQYQASGGTDPITRGLLTTNSLRMDEFVNKVLTTRLFETKTSHGFDLVSLNIQRGRDHGLLPYVYWRNACSKVFGRNAVFENQTTASIFRQIYGGMNTIDLFVGGLAEQRLSNSLLGPTFACIFGVTFKSVRAGDRFFYMKPGVFTRMQLASINRHTLSRVLCDNLDNLRSVQYDAFLTNQRRIPCTSIPPFNYMPWRAGGGDKIATKEMESDMEIDPDNAKLLPNEIKIPEGTETKMDAVTFTKEPPTEMAVDEKGSHDEVELEFGGMALHKDEMEKGLDEELPTMKLEEDVELEERNKDLEEILKNLEASLENLNNVEK